MTYFYVSRSLAASPFKRPETGSGREKKPINLKKNLARGLHFGEARLLLEMEKKKSYIITLSLKGYLEKR